MVERNGKYSVNGILSDIPSSGIFRVRASNWLRVCVSLGRTRNIKREARKSSGASSALNPRAGKCAFAIRFRRPFLIAGPARDANARSLVALGFRRTAIHFCFCRQVDWQEYSEFSNSALLISSAPGSGTNRQLGIFRNSEYRKIKHGTVRSTDNR
jgi:hypothetical protein